MKLSTKKIQIAIALAISFSSTSYAQQVVNTTVGSSATYVIQSKVFSPDLKQCSLIITQPNGSEDVVILEAPDFKTTLSYTPSMQGTSVVLWKGAYTYNGKPENAIAAGVQQIFTNIGQLATLNKLTQGIAGCPGEGTITVVATSSGQQSQPAQAQTNTSQSAGTMGQPQGRFKATATIPSVMNPPIENSAFKVKYNNDSTYRSMVDDFNVNRSKHSLTALRLYSELGDANAQFLYGLAHLEEWTGLYDPKRACYWIRESAVQGLSQARLVLANKAIYNKDCFDVPPTIEEAKTWAQLAGMSTERAVKENAEKLLQDILRIQITNPR